MKIYLIGFMGSGKSFLGKHLADLMEREFYDLDLILENEQNLTIPEIFTLRGEKEFRKLESRLLLSGNSDGVYATGGGIVETLANREFLLNSSGVVIWLDPDWETLYRRIRNSCRPLLSGKAEAAIFELYQYRKTWYAQLADIVYSGSSAKELWELIEKPD
ncbi:MAG: shikimate kinase [Candidatus Cloacimonetes bacterium]|nr:shikimate kinase [Candidatus Cloacimonadota bacterium]